MDLTRPIVNMFFKISRTLNVDFQKSQGAYKDEEDCLKISKATKGRS